MVDQLRLGLRCIFGGLCQCIEIKWGMNDHFCETIYLSMTLRAAGSDVSVYGNRSNDGRKRGKAELKNPAFAVHVLKLTSIEHLILDSSVMTY